MKIVAYTDQQGKQRRSLVRDRDPIALAPAGIPQDLPDLSQIDWTAVEVELHNELAIRGLFTWADVQREQTGVSEAILTVLRRRLIALYRIQAKEAIS